MVDNQEYRQEMCKCWEEFLQKHEISTADGVTADAFIMAFDYAYALGKQKETITQEEIEKASLKYLLNRQQAKHDAKREEEASLSDFDNTLKAWDAFDMAQAYEDGANFALGKETETITQEDVNKAAREAVKKEYFCESCAWKNDCYQLCGGENTAFDSCESPADSCEDGFFDCCECPVDLYENGFKAGANFALGKQQKDAESKSMCLSDVKEKIDKWMDSHTEEEVYELLKKYGAVEDADTVTINKGKYYKLCKCSRYMANWVPYFDVCPICGEYNQKGCVCANCHIY